MSIEAIIGNLVQFILYVGIFYIVLGWLKVSEKRLKRSLVLAAILKASELVGALVAGLLLRNFGDIGLFAILISTSLIVLLFYLMVRNLLKLKTWQYIAIPIGVSLVGNVALAFILMFYYKALT